MIHGQKQIRLPGANPGAKRNHLRNIVCALLHHEMIVTTHARAKYTARVAEKIITKGKRGTGSQARKALGFLRTPHQHTLESRENARTPPPKAPFGYPHIEPYSDPETFEPPTSLMPKVFMTLAERYKDREGGYTRILRYGRRQGDKAEMAVVCLVDGPRDMRFEMMARQVGRQAVEGGHLGEGEVLEGGVQQWEKKLRDKTKKALKQVLKMRSEDDKREFETKAKLWADQVVAQNIAVNGFSRPNPEVSEMSYSDQRRVKKSLIGYRPRAGERLSGMNPGLSGLGIARGVLGGPGTVMGRFRRKAPVVAENKFLVSAGSVKLASTKDL